jgi:hypothetical protein
MSSSVPAALGRVFISYRREDTDFPAGWLFQRLTTLAEYIAKATDITVDEVLLGMADEGDDEPDDNCTAGRGWA